MNKKWWLVLAAIFFVVILAGAGLVFWFEAAYSQKFYPGVKIGQLNAGGLAKAQVLEKLKNIEKIVQQNGLKFTAQDKEIIINPITISSADPDLARPILSFDWPKTIDQALAFGRDGSWYGNLIQQAKLLAFGQTVPVSYVLDRNEILATLQDNFSKFEKPPVNARLKIKNGKAEVLGEQSGYVFDYQKAADNLAANIESLNFPPINLGLEFKEPEIKKENTGSALNSLDKILAINSLKLKTGEKSWELIKAEYINWLEFQPIDNEVAIGFTKEKVLQFLQPIADEIRIEAKDAKFSMADGKVTEFQASQDGKELNLESSYQKINNQIIMGSADEIELAVDLTPAKLTTENINNLGIKELLGRGTSNFAGSPKNRRINIAVGAASLNGIIIKPGEEFSLLKALGPVDGAHGYKQELVIKGNRTVPEYGGGLCQIGTTTFRVALRSGLPITSRQNHSYRVVYYEPAGMDATIYDPAPDLKFINDTPGNILFTTKISGDTLTFEFYGTTDGRKIEISPDPPSIFNISSPGAPRYIESDDLKPGEKRQLEKPHKGANTYFKYTVTYFSGEVKEQEFRSHYIPWPEVWLVGKAATSTDSTVPAESPVAPPVAN
ncbi:MAG: VanW family protein [Patescibacteria group bacterium]